MTPVDGPLLRPEDSEALMQSITSDAYQERLKTRGGADFGFAFLDRARFRVSVLKSKGNYGMVLRTIPNRMFGLREIGLPDKVKELLTRPRGLILVTGPTGSGKSTTLASMVNWINENRDGHIITIEDPIEYYHPHKRCIVTQREVGTDVPSFAEAIRGALRQDPDVILVGGNARPGDHRGRRERRRNRPPRLRHLAHHRRRAHRRSHRRCFPRVHQGPDSHAASLVHHRRISQVLCRKIGGGRIASYEFISPPRRSAPIIRRTRPTAYRPHPDGLAVRMITLDAHLLSLVNRGLVRPEERWTSARRPSTSAPSYSPPLQRPGSLKTEANHKTNKNADIVNTEIMRWEKNNPNLISRSPRLRVKQSLGSASLG
jgi:twitching motility protein PilT